MAIYYVSAVLWPSPCYPQALKSVQNKYFLPWKMTLKINLFFSSRFRSLMWSGGASKSLSKRVSGSASMLCAKWTAKEEGNPRRLAAAQAEQDGANSLYVISNLDFLISSDFSSTFCKTTSFIPRGPRLSWQTRNVLAYLINETVHILFFSYF